MPYTNSHEFDASLMQSKWSRRFWADLAERTGSTAVGGVVTMLTADASGVVSGSVRQWWVVVGLPTVLVFLKCVLANMSSGATPSASLVNVSSNPS